MSRKLLLASYRDLRRHQGQALLNLLGIALGVAVMVAVDLANESARRAFTLSLEALTGSATHRIEARSGSLDDAFYRTLRVERGVRPATPVIEGYAVGADRTFRLLGVDPFSDGDFRAPTEGLAEGDLRALLTRPGTVLVSTIDATELDLRPGDRLALEIRGEMLRVEVVGSYAAPRPAALQGTLITDLATAQELLGRLGELDWIDLRLDPAQAEALRARLPDGVRLTTMRADDSAQRRMTDAFHTNLAAMGLLALLVGGLLVYNTTTLAVLRRRRLLGLLRVLGAGRLHLFAMVLGEALMLGAIGTGCGLLLGLAIGQGLVGLVTRTINDLYFVLTVSTLLVTPATLLKGFLVGLAATALAALIPALDAAATQPQQAARRSVLERKIHRVAPRAAFAGAVAVAAGLALVATAVGGLGVAFTALFLVIAGYALAVPWALLLLARPATTLANGLFGTQGRMAVRGVTGGLSRSGVAVAALTVAVAATVGIAIMVQSFRVTVGSWLEQTLTSDIYVTLPGSAADRSRERLPPQLRSELAAIPGVVSTSAGRAGEIQSGLGPLRFLAIEDSEAEPRGFRFLERESQDPWPPFRAGETVLITEALAYHHGLAAGDHLTLQTQRGPRDFRVGGVYADYSTDRGMVLLARPVYAALWKDPGVTTTGLRLAADASYEAVLDTVRALVAATGQPLAVLANADIRAESMAVFDRTFAITGVLRLLAIGVAFIGVLSALLALQLERAGEHATLRALGVTPRQLTGLVSLECGLMGIAAGVLSLPLGWGMAQLLIEVINKRSFGWKAVLLATGSALLAGLYPAWRLARTPPAVALREE
ncbi:MAG: ABC transporter permease [Gammaproteobacteria bacterium]